MADRPSEAGRGFADPAASFSPVDADQLASLLAASADIVLVIGPDGRVADAAVREGVCPDPVHRSWIGRSFPAIVTAESRPKAERLLRDPGGPARFEINHPMADEHDLPVSYATRPLPGSDRRLAFGHALSAVHHLQQQLVEQQLSFEHDLGRLRASSAQYRLLFDVSNAPHVIVDPATRELVESNAAASQALRAHLGASEGVHLERLFDDACLEDLDALLAGAYSSGRTEQGTLAWRWRPGEPVRVHVRFFRRERTPLISVQAEPPRGGAEPASEDLLARLGRETPDAIALLDGELRIALANESLLDLLGLVSDEQALGQPFERWLGRPNLELKAMRGAMDRQGSIRGFRTTLQPADGDPLPVEVSGVGIGHRGERLYGLAIRREDGARMPAHPDPARTGLRPGDEMIGLIGQMSLRDIVRESTDVIESLCIEAALKLTDGNRASAAELLGISRQALYTKLHRHGLFGDDGGEGNRREMLTNPSSVHSS